MNTVDMSLLLIPFLAGALVLSTHVPLGREVLARGIIFIDLAIAQVAGLGVTAAHMMEWGGDDGTGAPAQLSAAAAACLAALLLTWTGKRWPHIQEALIGLLFIFAACVGILMLAHDPHGGEHLRDLLAGQILWVGPRQLILPALVYSALLAGWSKRHRLGDAGFYLLFALAVTVSVQLVGVFLVFTSLIAPALASRRFGARRGLAVGYGIGAAGYAIGLGASAFWDLPAGPAIAATLCLLALTGLGASHGLKSEPSPL